jgi:leucyl-tRNA synthetase
MSKSKLNGVNPLDLISWKGREATRMTVVGEESSHRQRNWRGIEAEFKQMTGFLRKVMLVMDQFIQVRQMSSDQYPVIKRFAFKSNNQMKNPIDVEQELSRLKNLRNETIVKVKLHFGHDFKLGRGTKKLQELMYALSINVLVKEVSTDIEFEKTLGDFIVMMSALTPALAQELWEAFVDYADQDQLNDRYNFKDRNVRNQSFPEIDNDHIIPIIVKVDDDSLNIPVDRQIITRSDEQEIRKIAVEFCQNNRSLNDFNVDWNECVKRIHLSPGLKAVVKIETGFKTEKKSFAKKKKSKKDEDSDSEEEDR